VENKFFFFSMLRLLSYSAYALLTLPLPGRLCAKMTSSAKPEVHNVLHYRQRKTEPRPRLICTENFVKFERVFFDSYEQTDIGRTDTLIAILRTPNSAKVIRQHVHAGAKKTLTTSQSESTRNALTRGRTERFSNITSASDDLERR